MSFDSVQPKISFNNPSASADELASQSTQQQLVCTWSAHAPQSGSSFPRRQLRATAIANAAGELFLFGGDLASRGNNDVYMFSTRNFSTTLLQTSGEVPTPLGRYGHSVTLIGTTLFIYSYDGKNYSPYFLNLGTSIPLMSSPTPAYQTFALQNRESGPALWSMAPGRAIALTIP
jgi:Galactose oxidase, central domain